MMILNARLRLSQKVALLTIAVGVGSADRAHAQAALLGPGAAFIGVGISGVRTAELDDRLAARGYPTFGRTATALGVGAYRVLSSGALIGLEGHGLIIGEKPHSGGEAGLAGGYGTLGVGYLIELSPHVRAYPRLGVGAGGLTLWIESEPDSVAFDDVLANPRSAPDAREPLLSRDGLVIDVGAGMELLSGVRGGALVGLRFGYLIAPFDSSWDLVYQGKASGGPDASISGAYIRVVLGGAWRR